MRRDGGNEFNIKSSRDQNSKDKFLESRILKFKSFETDDNDETSEPNKSKKRKIDFNINENNIICWHCGKEGYKSLVYSNKNKLVNLNARVFNVLIKNEETL